MGASFVTRGYKQCSDAELHQLVDIGINDAGYEYGHDTYCGDWGNKSGVSIAQNGKIFTTYEEAESYIEDHSQKWDDYLIGVKYATNPPVSTVKLDTAISKIKQDIANIEVFLGFRYSRDNSQTIYTILLDRAKQSKSRLRTCGACDSRIRLSALKVTNCPVCGDKSFLLTDTDQKKLERERKKLAALKTKLAETEQNRLDYIKKHQKVDTKKWQWVVGGWCPS